MSDDTKSGEPTMHRRDWLRSAAGLGVRATVGAAAGATLTGLSQTDIIPDRVDELARQAVKDAIAAKGGVADPDEIMTLYREQVSGPVARTDREWTVMGRGALIAGGVAMGPKLVEIIREFEQQDRAAESPPRK